MKLVILDSYLVNFDGIGFDIGEHEAVWYPSTRPEEIVQRIGDAEGAVVNRAQMTAEVMDACPNLRYIGTFATGYNMIDVAAAQARGITVCNVPSYGTGAVAQHTFALLLEIVGRVGVFDRMVRNGGWKKGGGRELVSVPTYELAGKTLGVYGAGEIGSAVAHIAQAFGMQVLRYRRNPPPGGEGRHVPADELLARSDVVSIHMPLTGQTRGLFDARTIAGMKDGAVLLNTARGAIVDERAVAAALDSGKLLAYGADVLTSEPPEPGNPLVGHPRAVITPHVAWVARETRERLLRIAAQNFLAFAQRRPQNVVRAD